MNPITRPISATARSQGSAGMPDLLAAFEPQDGLGRTLKLGRESLLDEFNSKQIKIKHELGSREKQISSLQTEVDRAEKLLQGHLNKLEEMKQLEYQMQLRVIAAKQRFESEWNLKKEATQQYKRCQSQKLQLAKSAENLASETIDTKQRFSREKAGYETLEADAKRICDELESLHHEVDQDREKYEEKMRLIRKYNEEMDILTRKIAAMKYVVRATVTTWTPEVEASLGLMGQTRDFVSTKVILFPIAKTTICPFHKYE
eukprot:TRINITY_DN4077_c0_g1_i9.p1 TRINITY_DN4077_c0_g1~~TRINITY_DN4077_c0_g1_i9.p1  ORF type:complete len:260 (+),score=55.88 TRINITY_DN4077_c0_g1_i9:51-830(+)